MRFYTKEWYNLGMRLADEPDLQAKYDEIDEAADVAFVKMYESIPPEYESLAEELDERSWDYVTAIREADGDIEIELAGWDDEGESVQYVLCFEDARVLQDDGIVIEVSADEDGDIESTCDFSYYELYFGEDCDAEDGDTSAKNRDEDAEDIIEAHLLLDDGEPKYYTVRCHDISITMRRNESE